MRSVTVIQAAGTNYTSYSMVGDIDADPALAGAGGMGGVLYENNMAV